LKENEVGALTGLTLDELRSAFDREDRPGAPRLM
jgi:hypothetical protein